MRKIKFNSGFNLIELIITIGIVAVIATFALPSFTTLLANNRQQIPISEFNQALQLARNEAISSGIPVSMCSSLNAGANNPICNGADDDWGNGILIYQPALNSIAGVGVFNPANDRLIRQFDIQSQGGVINALGGETFFSFQNNGLLSNAGASIVFSACDDRGESAGTQITISATGRAQLLKGNKTTPIPNC